MSLILEKEDVNAFYEDWVAAMKSAQNSPDKPGDERAALDVVKTMFTTKEGNLDISQHDFSDGKTRPNLVVTYTPPSAVPGERGILIGGVHMDCVPAQLDKNPKLLDYLFDGTNGYGRGVLDNGSNVLACAHLLRYLADNQVELSRPVTVTFTADEERSKTRFGFESLLERGAIDVGEYAAAIFADTPWKAWNTKGAAGYSIDVKVDGAGHSGLNPSAGTVATHLLGYLQNMLAEKYPEVGSFDVGTLLQVNVAGSAKLDDETVSPAKVEGETIGMPEFYLSGDLRTVPKNKLVDIIQSLEDGVEEFKDSLVEHPQYKAFVDRIHIDFSITPLEDGYLMSDDVAAVAENAISQGYEEAGVEGQPALASIGGTLPGLGAFAEKGLLTIATGAGGTSLAYHAPNEFVNVDEVRRGPAYMFGVVKSLDEQLRRMD